MQSKKTSASSIALGGVLAALAVVIMAMGTIIPVATFICPVFCMLILQLVLKLCGSRIAWAWFGAVAILVALLAPDKEAAVVFVFLGYYPIIKPRFDKSRGKWLWKILFFNGVIAAVYFLLLRILGLTEVGEEYAQMGAVLTVIMVFLGNATFFLLDKLLGRNLIRR